MPRPLTFCCSPSIAKNSYGLTEKDMATLPHESIDGSLKTFFKLADVKALSIRKFEAHANNDKIEFPGQAIGRLVRTFLKTDYNLNRRCRLNWFDNDTSTPGTLKLLEEAENGKIVDYAKNRQSKAANKA